MTRVVARHRHGVLREITIRELNQELLESLLLKSVDQNARVYGTYPLCE